MQPMQMWRVVFDMTETHCHQTSFTGNTHGFYGTQVVSVNYFTRLKRKTGYYDVVILTMVATFSSVYIKRDGELYDVSDVCSSAYNSVTVDVTSPLILNINVIMNNKYIPGLNA